MTKTTSTLALTLMLVTTGCYVHTRTDPWVIAHDFETRKSCPEDGVAIAAMGPERPPADVASDSKRLELWRQKEKYEVYAAKGCGQFETYKCKCVTDLEDHSCNRACFVAGGK